MGAERETPHTSPSPWLTLVTRTQTDSTLSRQVVLLEYLHSNGPARLFLKSLCIPTQPCSPRPTQAPPLVKAQKKLSVACAGRVRRFCARQAKPAPSQPRLAFPVLTLRGSERCPTCRCLSAPSARESSGQHKSPLGFYRCIAGLVSHTTALQLSDDPCSKETDKFQHFLGMRSPENVFMLTVLNRAGS